MKPVGDLSVEELSALVCETLAGFGITVTLTGGACVQIWSEGRYVSKEWSKEEGAGDKYEEFAKGL